MFLRLFVLDLWANNCQRDHLTLWPWPFTLEVTALVANKGLRAPSSYQDWSSQAFPFGRWAYDTFLVSALVDLVTLIFEVWSSWALFPFGLRIYCMSINRIGDLDLWPFDLETDALYYTWCGQPSTNFNVSVTFLLDLWANNTVRRTTWPCTPDLWTWRSSYIFHQCTKFQIRRPFRSEDMMHFRSHH